MAPFAVHGDNGNANYMNNFCIKYSLLLLSLTDWQLLYSTLALLFY